MFFSVFLLVGSRPNQYLVFLLLILGAYISLCRFWRIKTFVVLKPANEITSFTSN